MSNLPVLAFTFRFIDQKECPSRYGVKRHVFAFIIRNKFDLLSTYGDLSDFPGDIKPLCDSPQTDRIIVLY